MAFSRVFLLVLYCLTDEGKTRSAVCHNCLVFFQLHQGFTEGSLATCGFHFSMIMNVMEGGRRDFSPEGHLGFDFTLKTPTVSYY